MASGCAVRNSPCIPSPGQGTFQPAQGTPDSMGYLCHVGGKEGKQELGKLSILALFSSSNHLSQILFKVSKRITLPPLPTPCFTNNKGT